MWGIVIASLIALAALALAVKLLRSSSPGERVQRRLKILQTEFDPEELEPDTNLRKVERFTRYSWMNSVLGRLNLASRLRLLLQQANVERTVESLLMMCLFSWIGTTCLLFLRIGSLMPAAALGALVIPLPWMYVLSRRAKRFRRFEEQLPEAIDLLCSALRAGHSLMTAIGFMGQESNEPLSGEFDKCFKEQNFGVDLRTALLNLANRVAVQDLQIFTAAVLIQKESGGNLAEVLEKVAQTSRERFRLRKQIRVHTAQGRMTGWILAFLPVVLGFGMYMVNPEGISILWIDPTGLKLLYTALVLNVLGALVIRQVVRIRV
jgi:tight adherence protein B